MNWYNSFGKLFGNMNWSCAIKQPMTPKILGIYHKYTHKYTNTYVPECLKVLLLIVPSYKTSQKPTNRRLNKNMHFTTIWNDFYNLNVNELNLRRGVYTICLSSWQLQKWEEGGNVWNLCGADNVLILVDMGTSCSSKNVFQLHSIKHCKWSS